MIGRIVVLKNVCALIPTTFKYVILHGIWDFIDMMITDHDKIMLDYPGGLDLIRAVLKRELSLVGSRRDMQHKRH